ncbi:AI-2E family transporter [bacterium]|nr:AI-2E family transporter [bacterium]MCP5462892.1 AI-2E family transporter [bacterium]
MTVVSFCLSFIVVVLSFYLLIVGKALLIPMVIAFFIWYMITVINGIFRKISIRGRQLSNALCFCASLVTFTVAGWIFLSLIGSEITQVVNAAQEYQVRLEKLIDRAFELFGQPDAPTIRQMVSRINLSTLIPVVATAITNIASNAGVILIYLIFLVVEGNSFNEKIAALVGDARREKIVRTVIKRIEMDIRKYIGIKTLISLLTAALSFFILRIVGVDFARFWACMIFILNFIPTIGSIIATIFPCVLALIQFESLYPFIVVAVGISSVQFFIGNVFEPRIMGNTLNMSPLVILIALALWGSIWGIVGMFLCVPLMVIIMIVLAHFPQTRPIAILLSKDGHIIEP